MAMPNLVPPAHHLGRVASRSHGSGLPAHASPAYGSLGSLERGAYGEGAHDPRALAPHRTSDRDAPPDRDASKGKHRDHDRARMDLALVSYEPRGSGRSVLPPPSLPPFDDFSHDEPSPALRAPSPPSIAVRPAHRSEELHPGDLVAGKYRVRAILGRNHGLVLDAFHTEFDQRVIIKLLPAGSGDDKEIERFRREARTLSKLESEHVARILDVGTEPDGSFYLVRQYLEGSDLSSYLKQHGALALPDAVLLVLQVAEAAAETHGHGIVIRELSPEHVFLTARVGGAPVLKIVDFGTAKLMRDLSAPGVGGELTATAMFGLSPYSSPELVRKARSVDQRTDVWSLGAIFYELLTGRPPFAGDMAQLMLGITREEPVPVSSYRPDLPPELDQIVGWCLAKDVDGRFKNVHAFAHALSPYATPEAQILIERIGAIAQAARQRRGGSVPPPAPSLRTAAVAPGPGAPAPPPSAPMYSSGLEFGRTSAPPPAPASLPAGSLLGPSPSYSTPPPAPALSALTAPAAQTQPFRGAEATPGSLRPAVAGGAATKAMGLSPLARQAILWSLATIAVMLPAVVVVLVLRARAPEPAAGPITVESKAEPQKTEPAATVAAKEPEAPPTATATAAPAPSPTPEPSASAAPTATASAPTAEPTAIAVASLPSKPTAAPKPTAKAPAATATSKPPAAPATAGGTGTLMAIALGDPCAFTVNGSSKGSGKQISVTLPAGSYTVGCKSSSGSKSKGATVKAGEKAVVTFK